MHDKNTLRTTGFNGEIAQLSKEELKQLDAGAWKGPQFAGEQIPTLDEILSIIPAGKRLFIEIKGNKSLIAPLYVALQRSQIASTQILIMSFSYAVVKIVKATLPEIEVLWLRGTAALKEFSLESTIELCREANLAGLAASGDWLLETSVCQRIRELQLKLFVYTINDAHFVRPIAEAGVNGIITDRPDLIRAHL